MTESWFSGRSRAEQASSSSSLFHTNTSSGKKSRKFPHQQYSYKSSRKKLKPDYSKSSDSIRENDSEEDFSPNDSTNYESDPFDDMSTGFDQNESTNIFSTCTDDEDRSILDESTKGPQPPVSLLQSYLKKKSILLFLCFFP